MGAFSIWHWLVILAIVLLLFGTGRISTLMGDLAKGVKAFKKGLEDEDNPSDAPKSLTTESVKPAEAKEKEKDEAAHH